MNRIKIIWMTTCLLLSGHMYLMAQMDTIKMFAALKGLQAKYQSNPVSFDISYTYTSKLHPDIVIEEMKGNIALAGSLYHYQMDSTEVISNAHYNIVLFKEDKIMYLSKPATINAVDPVQQIRGLILSSAIKNCSVKGGIITVSFRAGENMSELQMVINEKTGYLSYMQYVIKTEMLMEQHEGPAEAEYGEYAVVRSTLNNYVALSADRSRFDEINFFYKEGNELKTTAAFSDYKIFIGSPNL